MDVEKIKKCLKCGQMNEETNKFCGNCAAQLDQNTTIQDVDPELELGSVKDNQSATDTIKPNPIRYWKILIAVLVVAIVIAVAAFRNMSGKKITQKNVDAFSVYNTELGVGVRLGMSKTEIDQLLGEPVEGDEYEYKDDLFVTYKDGKAVVFCIGVNNVKANWVVYKSLSKNSTQADSEKSLGIPTGEASDGEAPYAIYVFDKNMTLLHNEDDGDPYAFINFNYYDSGDIENIYIISYDYSISQDGDSN